MRSENITFRNALFFMIIVTTGKAIVLGFPHDVEQDTWAALLLSMGGVLPLMLVYGRLLHLMPGLDIFQMATTALGQVPGKIASGLMLFYYMHLGAVILGNYSEFIHLTSLFRTPVIVITLLLFSACLYLAKSGVETLGKWSAVMVAITLLTLTFIVPAFIPRVNLENLQPTLSHTPEQLALAGLKLVPLPFGESVILLAIIGSLEKGRSPYRLFTLGALISCGTLIAVFVGTCGVLGPRLLSVVYFPTYKAASLVQAGQFLERIEAFLAFTSILSGVSKVAACIIASAKGISCILNFPSYRNAVLPMGTLMTAFSVILFHNIVEMFEFIDVYTLYAILFQVIIPILIWVTGEIRVRLGRFPAGRKENGVTIHADPYTGSAQ